MESVPVGKECSVWMAARRAVEGRLRKQMEDDQGSRAAAFTVSWRSSSATACRDEQERAIGVGSLWLVGHGLAMRTLGSATRVRPPQIPVFSPPVRRRAWMGTLRPTRARFVKRTQSGGKVETDGHFRTLWNGRWRSGRDSNPRYAFDVYSLSRRAPSTTRPPLRIALEGGSLSRGAAGGKRVCSFLCIPEISFRDPISCRDIAPRAGRVREQSPAALR